MQVRHEREARFALLQQLADAKNAAEDVAAEARAHAEEAAALRRDVAEQNRRYTSGSTEQP